MSATAPEMLLAAYSDIISPEVTTKTSRAYPLRIGMAKPPHTTSPRTSYRITSGRYVPTASSSSSLSNAAMMPLPAHPLPGLGPPHSTQRTPLRPSWTRSPSSASGSSRMTSRTVGMRPPVRARVESAFGSQPICITLRPDSARAAETFPTVVDLPMPPLP